MSGTNPTEEDRAGLCNMSAVLTRGFSIPKCQRPATHEVTWEYQGQEHGVETCKACTGTFTVRDRGSQPRFTVRALHPAGAS